MVYKSFVEWCFVLFEFVILEYVEVDVFVCVEDVGFEGVVCLCVEFGYFIGCIVEEDGVYWFDDFCVGIVGDVVVEIWIVCFYVLCDWVLEIDLGDCVVDFDLVVIDWKVEVVEEVGGEGGVGGECIGWFCVEWCVVFDCVEDCLDLC